MAFRPLLKQVYLLNEIDSKLSYSIAKELAIIELNLLWEKDSDETTANRLDSLSSHILRSFKESNVAKDLAVKVKALASSIRTNNI